MEAFNITINSFTALAAVGTFVIALFGINLGRKATFKNETLYGKEAEERFNAIKSKLPDTCKFVDGLYEGGNKITPQFEVERFRFDSQTMGQEWKGINKTIRYYYSDSGKTMVKGWKLK